MNDREIDPRDLDPEDSDTEPIEEDALEPAVPVSGDKPLEVGEADWLEGSSDLGDEDDRDRPA